jgi:hypothetical protein
MNCDILAKATDPRWADRTFIHETRMLFAGRAVVFWRLV